MTWFKVDDGFYDHPKLTGVPMASRGLWVTAGSYCARHLTDGVISWRQIRSLGGTRAQVRGLVDAGLWRAIGDATYQFTSWRKGQDGDYRKNIRKSVRKEVFERDGHRCVFCGATDGLSLDHIVRYRDDGPDTTENLRVLCMPCNLERG